MTVAPDAMHPGRPEREAALARRFLAEIYRRSITSARKILHLARLRGQFSIVTLKREKRKLGIRSTSTHDHRGRFVYTWIWPEP